MSSQEQIRRDLVRADAWAALSWLERIVWRLNHPDDEFGFYFHAVSDLADRLGDRPLGETRKRLSVEDVLWTLLRQWHKTGGNRRDKSAVQGLPERGRNDRPPLTISGTTVHHAPPKGRQGPSRTYA